MFLWQYLILIVEKNLITVSLLRDLKLWLRILVSYASSCTRLHYHRLLSYEISAVNR